VALAERCLAVLGLPASADEAGLTGAESSLRLTDAARMSLRIIAGDGHSDDRKLVDRVVAIRWAARRGKGFRSIPIAARRLAEVGHRVKDSKSGSEWAIIDPNRPDGKRELEYIFGVHAVAEAIAAGEPIEPHHRRTAAHRRSRALGHPQRGGRRGTRIEVEEKRCSGAFGDARHQHVVAVAPPFRYTEWSALLAAVRERPDAIVVALDISKTRNNVGAILRTPRPPARSAPYFRP